MQEIYELKLELIRGCGTTLCAGLTLIPQSLKDCCASCTMSSFLSDFHETEAMFLEFAEELDNPARGSSLVDDNSAGTSQLSTTPTPRKPEKPIFLYVVRFSQVIGMYVQKKFPIHCPNWTANVGREYIKVVKGDLQRFFVLDFNDQAMNRFIEHQMLSTFKELWNDCHKHFKKYREHEEARTNPPHILVGRDED
ncbi:CACTA en-spm transposon protein [Cucumis melo var. makuwa]|uniref:CACTA en-spm transposon protein n=1 Tax=Cucumis melo var. makuwa TaxID=1194695 RepID=A0A5D3BUE6_CUCMM|nr:CACTA en-spm transposon protein [Cucumis melo var. makuwa]TYK03293.1 CACTA en-spm transposon protein [Cucumis melo var. makuwa]